MRSEAIITMLVRDAIRSGRYTPDYRLSAEESRFVVDMGLVPTEVEKAVSFRLSKHM